MGNRCSSCGSSAHQHPTPAAAALGDSVEAQLVVSDDDVMQWAELQPAKSALRLKGAPTPEQTQRLKQEKQERTARQQAFLTELCERLGGKPLAEVKAELNARMKAARTRKPTPASPARGSPSKPPPPATTDYAGPPAEPASRYSASVTLLGGPFAGEDQWLGGELGADGNIYGVPGTAKSVVKIDPRTDEVTDVGQRTLSVVPCAIRGERFKWLRVRAQSRPDTPSPQQPARAKLLTPVRLVCLPRVRAPARATCTASRATRTRCYASAAPARSL